MAAMGGEYGGVGKHGGQIDFVIGLDTVNTRQDNAETTSLVPVLYPSTRHPHRHMTYPNEP